MSMAKRYSIDINLIDCLVKLLSNYICCQTNCLTMKMLDNNLYLTIFITNITNKKKRRRFRRLCKQKITNKYSTKIIVKKND